MSNKKIQWTTSQLAAINSVSNDISVTASAGTGKTTVLSSRCVRVLGDEVNGCDISGMLVLTYTDAAAGSMASRIRSHLKIALAAGPNPRLNRQLLMLDSADISTLHSFCKRTISKYFHKLGLDSAFRLIDEDEKKLLMSEVLGQTMEDAFNDMPDAMDILFAGRKITNSKNSFLNTIIDINEFLNTTVSSQKFFDLALQMNDAAAFSVELVTPFLLSKLAMIKDKIEQSYYLDSILADSHWKNKNKADLLLPIISAIQMLEKSEFSKLVKLFKTYEKPKWASKPKGFDDELKVFIQAPAKQAIDEFVALADFPYINSQYEKIVAPQLSLQMKTLIELVKRFGIRYEKAKSSLGALDFSDLEHKMLELLCDGDDFECAGPSDVAMSLRGQYKYIFIDEYQDINPVQQRIINLLGSGQNIFVVGDVKQSIYAWRGTDCKLFVERLKRAEAGSEVERLDLNENFRSSPGILDFVNNVFSRIMFEPLSPINYDDLAALKWPSALDDSDNNQIPVELLLVEQDASDDDDEDKKNDTDESSDDGDNGESKSAAGSSKAVCLRAMAVANKIKHIVGNEDCKIFDKAINADRPIRYDDIVILMRSIANRGNDYVQVLRSAGIPVTSASSAGYFETTEINDMISLLRALDNPQQDIELAAVMAGPFFNFTHTELAIVSTFAEGDLYSSIIAYKDAGSDDMIIGKLEKFIVTIENWRSLSRTGALSDLIWYIYRQTRYLSYVLATPGGAQRRANLLKLHQRAIQFEGFATSSQSVSLSRFVSFLERLLAQGGDWAPAEPDSSSAHAVRIMSVHKSKGLEFGVVIVAEMNSPFSNRYKSGDCIVDAKNTIGLKIYDDESKNKYTSLSWQLASDAQYKTNLAEEMRILYVAMTRACSRLILTGAVKSDKPRQLISNAAICKKGHLPNWLVSTAKSHLDWTIMALANYKVLATRYKPMAEIEMITDNLFTLEVVDEKMVNASFRYDDQLPQSQNLKLDKAFYSRIKKSLSWQYSFGQVQHVRAKDSVSNLSHFGDEYRQIDYADCFDRPDIKSLGTAPLIIGSTTHLLIQKLNLDSQPTIESIDATKSNLVKSGTIPANAAKSIKSSSIENFFKSMPGSMAIGKSNKVMREWPFTIGISAAEIYPEKNIPEDEKIIVQGIVDMVIETKDGLFVVDFKTDHVSAEAINDRAVRYRNQLGYYCRAAEVILKKKIAGAYLYFITPGLAVEI